MPPIAPITAPPMSYVQARHYADKISEWLAPHCERLAIAGSIRRGRPACHDIDIVCIPKVTEHKDLLNQVVARDNHVLEFLRSYVQDHNPAASKLRTPHFISGGETEGKQLQLQLPKCQLDLWFADDKTWATRLLCRTGSKEHNMWFAERATGRDLHWSPYQGLRPLLAPEVDTSYRSDLSEESLYHALGLELIAPQNREQAWLAKHIDSGL